jgi:hypothetical protein
MKQLTSSLVLLTFAVAHAADVDDKNINNYLVDITGGAVSASGLIDAKGMAIASIETSQDIVLALTPFASRDAGKGAFGIAITPAKTTLLPMSGRTYVAPGAWYSRLAGNLTLSYAQNQTDYSDQPYKKSAFAIDTVYFFKLEDDPVYQASAAFKRCAELPNEFGSKEKALNDKRQRGELTGEAFQAELVKLNDQRATELTKCIDADISALAKARWNSARMSISYGEGRIKPVGGGLSYSLGKSFNLNAQHPLGRKAVAQLSLRHSRDALDLDSLNSPAPSFKSSRLAALRLTYGDQEESNLRALAEISSSRSSSADAFKEAFMYAIGIDKRIVKGTWLEFRLGRNRSAIGGKEQSTALLALNLSPTLFEFKK